MMFLLVNMKVNTWEMKWFLDCTSHSSKWLRLFEWLLGWNNCWSELVSKDAAVKHILYLQQKVLLVSFVFICMLVISCMYHHHSASLQNNPMALCLGAITVGMYSASHWVSVKIDCWQESANYLIACWWQIIFRVIKLFQCFLVRNNWLLTNHFMRSDSIGF